ncbi:MAG: hypothetical protein IJ741_03650 [Schwartzia sp.]|nr:hypothetical protein [Schwartzia sp. (in: firmicutes)]
MVVYIAKKPCRFGGQIYRIDDKIPADKIQERRIGSLVRMGVIVQGGEVEGVASQPTPPTPVLETEQVNEADTVAAKQEPEKKTAAKKTSSKK